MTESDERGKPRDRKSEGDMTRSSPRPNASMSPDIQNKIGQRLRAVYSDIVDQGVPDRFAKLIEQLDAQSKNKNDNEKS